MKKIIIAATTVALSIGGAITALSLDVYAADLPVGNTTLPAKLAQIDANSITYREAETILTGIRAINNGYLCNEGDPGALKVPAQAGNPQAGQPPVPEHYQCRYVLKDGDLALAQDLRVLADYEQDYQTILQGYQRQAVRDALAKQKIDDVRAAVKAVLDDPKLTDAKALRDAIANAAGTLSPDAALSIQDKAASLAGEKVEFKPAKIKYADLNWGSGKDQNPIPREVIADILPIVKDAPTQ